MQSSGDYTGAASSVHHRSDSSSSEDTAAELATRMAGLSVSGGASGRHQARVGAAATLEAAANSQHLGALQAAPAPLSVSVGVSTRIDHLCIGRVRRHPEAMQQMINMARSETKFFSYPHVMTAETEIGRLGYYHMEAQVKPEVDPQLRTYIIANSRRPRPSAARGPSPYASDAYLAHLTLANRATTGQDTLPDRLPEHIVRNHISNDDAQALSRELFGRYPAGGGSITLTLDRERPNAQANIDLHKVLRTVNGATTAAMVNDFNALQGTEHTIESVTISYDSYDRPVFDFTISEP